MKLEGIDKDQWNKRKRKKGTPTMACTISMCILTKEMFWTISVSSIDSYQVNVTVDNCTTTEFITIDKINCIIPKGVSPNGDGLNDSWDLSGFDVKKVQIFNRYGKEVYSKSNYVNEWFGRANNGNELPDGTYYFVIELNDGAPRTGWVYINREQ